MGPDGRPQRIDVFSLVGLIPLFACEIVDQRLLMNAPRFVQVMNAHAGGLFDGHRSARARPRPTRAANICWRWSTP